MVPYQTKFRQYIDYLTQLLHIIAINYISIQKYMLYIINNYAQIDNNALCLQKGFARKINKQTSKAVKASELAVFTADVPGLITLCRYL